MRSQIQKEKIISGKRPGTEDGECEKYCSVLSFRELLSEKSSVILSGRKACHVSLAPSVSFNGSQLWTTAT